MAKKHEGLSTHLNWDHTQYKPYNSNFELSGKWILNKESISEQKKNVDGSGGREGGVEGTLKPKQYDRLSREVKYKTATIYTM